MLNILADAFNAATRTTPNGSRPTDAESRRLYLEQARHARRMTNLTADDRFYHRS